MDQLNRIRADVTRAERTDDICFELRAFPIMTDFRQARLANIFLVFEGLTTSFPARLPMRSSSSSKSGEKERARRVSL